jgi:hypothetical protein
MTPPTSGTGWDPAPPASATDVDALNQQLQQGLQQLSQMGIALPGTTAAATGGTSSHFDQAVASSQQVAMVRVTDGASAVEDLDRIAAARQRRLASLEEAYAADIRETGHTDTADLQRLTMERTLTQQVSAMAAKMRPLASTIDAAEGRWMVSVVSHANSTGAMDPVELARLMLQVEGSAANVPASYLASANRGQDVAQQLQMQLRMELMNVNQLPRPDDPVGTVPTTDPVAQQRAAELADQLARVQRGLKANFDLARADPAVAQAKLDAALATPDAAESLARLAGA